MEEKLNEALKGEEGPDQGPKRGKPTTKVRRERPPKLYPKT